MSRIAAVAATSVMGAGQFLRDLFGRHKKHDSRAIGNLFLDKSRAAKKPLTLMHVIKFVYIAHGHCLAKLDSPLICHDVEVWRHGPVIPEVFHAFKNQMPGTLWVYKKAAPYYPGIGPGPFYSAVDKLDAEQNDIIDQVYEKYSDLTLVEISEITHKEGTPWSKAAKQGLKKISRAEISAYYKNFLAYQNEPGAKQPEKAC